MGNTILDVMGRFASMTQLNLYLQFHSIHCGHPSQFLTPSGPAIERTVMKHGNWTYCNEAQNILMLGISCSHSTILQIWLCLGFDHFKSCVPSYRSKKKKFFCQKMQCHLQESSFVNDPIYLLKRGKMAMFEVLFWASWGSTIVLNVIFYSSLT